MLLRLFCSPSLLNMIFKTCSFEVLLYLVFVSFKGYDFMPQIFSLKRGKIRNNSTVAQLTELSVILLEKPCK